MNDKRITPRIIYGVWNYKTKSYDYSDDKPDTDEIIEEFRVFKNNQGYGTDEKRMVIYTALRQRQSSREGRGSVIGIYFDDCDGMESIEKELERCGEREDFAR